MRASHLTPHNAELRSSLSSLSSVDVSHLLSQVEINSRLVVAAVNFQEVGVVVSIAATSVLNNIRDNIYDSKL